METLSNLDKITKKIKDVYLERFPASKYALKVSYCENFKITDNTTLNFSKLSLYGYNDDNTELNSVSDALISSWVFADAPDIIYDHLINDLSLSQFKVVSE